MSLLIIILIKMIMLIVVSSYVRFVFKKLNEPARNLHNSLQPKTHFYDSLMLLSKKDMPVAHFRNMPVKIVLYIRFVLSILLIVIIPLFPSSPISDIPMALPLSLLLMVSLPILDLLILLFSSLSSKNYEMKRIIENIIHYSIVYILSILAIIIYFTKNHYSIALSYSEFFQLIQDFKEGTKLTILITMMIMANLSAIVGFYRKRNLDTKKGDNIIVTPFYERFSGKKKALYELSENNLLFSYLVFNTLFFSIILSAYINISIEIIEAFLFSVFFVLISFIGRGKPRTFMDRNVHSFIRTPLIICAILMILAISL